MFERILGFIFLLSSGFLLAFIVLVWYTLRTLTVPPRRTYSWAVSRKRAGDPGELTPPLSFRPFKFQSRDSELCAWEITGQLSGGPTIIITGGWGESKVTMLERAAQLCQFADTLILWDLPGHGESHGTTSLGAHESEDLITLAKSLPASGDLFLFGYSLGAGVSIEAAARNQIPNLRGVIAEAPYRLPVTPALNVLNQLGVPYTLNLPAAMMIIGLKLGYGLDFGTSKLYDRAGHAKLLKHPLLVIHGDLDAICPPLDGVAISQAANGRYELIKNADHVNLWVRESSRQQAISAIHTFCRETLGNRTIGHAKTVEQPKR